MLHYVGEKKFESVNQLVADGLIYLYIETRGADILQKLSEASNYEHSPYYKVRNHNFSFCTFYYYKKIIFISFVTCFLRR